MLTSPGGQPPHVASHEPQFYLTGSPHVLSEPAPNKDEEEQTLTQQSGGAE